MCLRWNNQEQGQFLFIYRSFLEDRKQRSFLPPSWPLESFFLSLSCKHCCSRPPLTTPGPVSISQEGIAFLFFFLKKNNFFGRFLVTFSHKAWDLSSPLPCSYPRWESKHLLGFWTPGSPWKSSASWSWERKTTFFSKLALKKRVPGSMICKPIQNSPFDHPLCLWPAPDYEAMFQFNNI